MNNNLGNAALQAFHRQLHEWYSKNGRKSLPWRNTRDPYAIYVSEVMLQQTQVKTVQDHYYAPFLKRFPTLGALAKAPQRDVLKAWEGLGYYNRAVNLHNAARRCTGALPKTVEELLELPGIGQNTAQAIAVFAYGIPVPVMEANVKRVIARIYALKDTKNALLWQLSDGLLDRKNSFDYNQAMMDLGAMVCTKRAPKCGICPATTICQGKATPHAYPALKQKKAVPVRRKHIVVLHHEGKYFAEPRKGRFLNGLYHFGETVKKPQKARALGRIHQQYSHFTLEADVYLVSIRDDGRNWYSLQQLNKLPFSAAEQKILGLLTG